MFEDKPYELLHGDCFTNMKQIENKSIDLIITDPPYLHNKGGNGGGNTTLANSKMYSKDSMVMNKMSDFSEDKCYILLNESERILKKMNAYYFCNDSLVPYYLKWAIEHKYKYTILTWNKPLSILNRKRYSTNMEYIVRIYTNGCALNKLDLESNTEYKEYYSKYRLIKQVRNKGKLHPTQKPIDIINGYVLLSSSESDVILDPFMGSGTIGESSLVHNRKFIGIELDDNYFEVSKNRISDTYNKLNS